MTGSEGAVRVLFVLADTDRTDVAAEVLGLHRALVSQGVQMRTVALGPGRLGGLDNLVPVLSPATRSLGAITQLRREQRWADVVVCWGGTTAMVQRLGGSRRRTPTVIGDGADGRGGGLLASFAGRGAVGAPDGWDPVAWRNRLRAVHQGGAQR